MISLDHAVVYDIETLPNCFSLSCVGLFNNVEMTFEISDQGRDDRVALLAWFEYWRSNATPMIGFNSVSFDYPVLHYIWQNPDCSVYQIHARSMEIIKAFNRYENRIWQDDRFAPQLDLFLLHHFDNRAKQTSLKALQFAMRSDSVMEMPLPFDQPLTREQIDKYLLPYNRHDIKETKRFALFSLEALKFRIGLSETLPGDVLNFSDGKIGRTIIQQRLGDDLCFTWESGRREPRKTPRQQIALADIIFPYIAFDNPEFNRILSWMRTQTISEDEVTGNLKTKGVFTGIKAHVGGIDFHFGTGGIHGSVESQRFAADAELALVDIDVKQLYPNIAIKNRLYPEHLGEGFCDVYATVPAEREEWQKKKGKKCVEANAMKLASNVPYGDSNNQYSFMYDPRYTMATTINGQLMLCMLAEWLLEVPTLQIIAINTDGITYRIRRKWMAHAEAVRVIWMRKTRLVLEEAQYARMWVRDVNSYCAEGLDGELKLKGAYWFPRNFPDDISNAQPPAWHKDFSAQVVIMAAVEHMVTGADIERFIYGHQDKFDFMCRAKVDRGSQLMIGDQETQRITRYYLALNGAPLRKVMPPAGPLGEYKRRSGISDWEWSQRPASGEWHPDFHTKNKSRYEVRETQIEAGFLVAECNVASRFDWSNVNYDWYIAAAKKLVIL